MIIYIIIYHIRNNKNFNIDMSIKYNTIISTIISTIITTSPWQKKKKEKESITIIACINKSNIYSYIENISQLARQ